MRLGIGARDVPVLRDELKAWLSRSDTLEHFRQLGNLGWAGKPGNADVWLDRERALMRLGELFYVNTDMTRLAAAAGKTLPAFMVAREDLPSEHGLMIFDEPIGEWEDLDNWAPKASVVGVGWWVDVTDRAKQFVVMVFYTWRDLNLASAVVSGSLPDRDADLMRTQLPRLCHDNESAFVLGQDLDFPDDDSILDTWGRTVIAAWLLMQQPGVGATSPHSYGGRDASWLKRHRLKPSPVNVVRLRYAPSAHEGGPHGDREYQHRWMVRGHWRRQWYSSRGSHIPIWISPHIKGPEGAPLKTGETVHAWVR